MKATNKHDRLKMNKKYGSTKPKAKLKQSKKRKLPKSSSSNPTANKYREAAKRSSIGGHFRLGTGKDTLLQQHLGSQGGLTLEALEKHNAAVGGFTEDCLQDDSASIGGTTFNTWATNLTGCTNVTFNRVHRYINSSSAVQKEILAVLAAVTEVIKEKGGEGKDVQYFAVLVSSLQEADKTDTKMAMAHLLNIVIKRVPVAVLQSRFSQVAKTLLDVITDCAKQDTLSPLKPALSCLASLLRVQDMTKWTEPSTEHAYRTILAFISHKKPKLRKVAQKAVKVVLRGSLLMQQTPAPPYHPVAPITAQHCLKQIETSRGPSSKVDILHILSLLKDVLSLFPHSDVRALCESVLRLMTLTDLVVRSTCMDVLHRLFIAKPSSKILSAEMNGQIVTALYDYQPSEKDSQPMIAWLKVMETAAINMACQNIELCMNHLPRIFSTCMTCLLSDRRDVAKAAVDTMKTLLLECVEPNKDTLTTKNLSNQAMTVLQKIIKSLEAGMSYQFHSMWALVFQLWSTVFLVLGKITPKLLMKLNFPYTQTQVAQASPSSENLTIVSEKPAALLTNQPQHLINSDLPQSFMKSGKSRNAGATSARKSAKNFTSEFPISRPAAIDPLTLPATTDASTLQFWRTLLSLFEAAKVNSMNSVLPVVTSSVTVTTSSVMTLPLTARTGPMTSLASRSPAITCDTESLPMHTRFSGNDFPCVSVGSNSNTDLHALSLTRSLVMQPKSTHCACALPQQLSTPPVLNTSAVLSMEQWANPVQISSTAYSYTTSAPVSSAQRQQVLPNTWQMQSAEDNHIQSKIISGLNIPKVDMADHFYSLARAPIRSDSIKFINTSPRASATTTSSCRSGITCPHAVKDKLPTTSATKGSIIPASMLAPSQHSSFSTQDNSNNEDFFNQSYISMNNLKRSTHENNVNSCKTESQTESIAGNHGTVNAREINPVLDCVGNSLVQIFLPCSEHLYTGSQTVRIKPKSSVTTLKMNSLKSIVKKNRTKILNILRRENIIKGNRKTDVEQVIVSPGLAKQCMRLHSNSEVNENSCAEVDVENENTTSFNNTYLHYNISENLEENNQIQDGVVYENGEICTVGDDSVHLYNNCEQSLNLDSVLSVSAVENQGNITSTVRNSKLLCKDKDSSELLMDYESQHNEAMVIGMSTKQRCENSRSPLCNLVSSSSVLEKWSTAPATGMTAIKTAKIHNVKLQGELLYVPVGESFKSFLREHPLVQGVYLHKGKREIKKQLAQLCRHCDISDRMTTWRRGKEILERNCFDDYFELTEDGRREQQEVHASKKRDQYVVNWYVWCPGHGNCRRKCGGYGSCISGCRGMQHKQDRHNCSLMINMKLFLSDLSTWRVNITGIHIPSGSDMLWDPPILRCKPNNPSTKGHNSDIKIRCIKASSPKKEEIVNTAISDEPVLSEVKSPALDVWSFSETSNEALTVSRTQCTFPISESHIKDILVEAPTTIPTKKRISKMLSSLKRRRDERLTSNKSSLMSSKNIFTLPHGVHERQTTHTYGSNNNNNNNNPHIGSTNDNSMPQSSYNFKQGGNIIQDKDNCGNLVSHKSIPVSTQTQQLSSELLRYLTSNITQDITTLNSDFRSNIEPNLSEHNWILPSGYTQLLQSSLPSESNSSLDVASVFENSQGKNVKTSSLFSPVLFGGNQNHVRLATIDCVQSDPIMHTISSLQEDENVIIKCKEVFKSSEDILPLNTALDFEQPFLSANTFSEILHQANCDPCNLAEQTATSELDIDTELPDFSSSDSLEFASNSNQTEQVHSLCQQSSSCELAAAMQQLLSSKSVHFDSRSQAVQNLSTKTQQFLLPNSTNLIMDSLPGLNILLSLAEAAKSNSLLCSSDTVPTNLHSSRTTLNASQFTSHPSVVQHHHYPQIETSHSLCDNIDSYENVTEQLQTEPLPSYQEATVALAEQLGLSQSGQHM